MIANWRGLAPEERWWFYTTINATRHGHTEHGNDRGWRKAIKIAFAENPIQLPPSALLVLASRNPDPLRTAAEGAVAEAVSETDEPDADDPDPAAAVWIPEDTPPMTAPCNPTATLR